jgi:hypothetical protein
MKIQRIQVDDQLLDARFPVLFYPDIDFMMRSASEPKPFFYILAVKQNNAGKNSFNVMMMILYATYSYFSTWCFFYLDDTLLNISHFETYIQEFDAQLDEDFLLKALDFVKIFFPKENFCES